MLFRPAPELDKLVDQMANSSIALTEIAQRADGSWEAMVERTARPFGFQIEVGETPVDAVERAFLKLLLGGGTQMPRFKRPFRIWITK